MTLGSRRPAGADDPTQVALDIAPNQELWMKHLADAPLPAQYSMVTESTWNGRSSVTICALRRAAGGPTVIGLARCPDGDDRTSGGPVNRCSVVAFDQAEEVLDAALVNVERVDMSEVVLRKIWTASGS